MMPIENVAVDKPFAAFVLKKTIVNPLNPCCTNVKDNYVACTVSAYGLLVASLVFLWHPLCAKNRVKRDVLFFVFVFFLL